MVENNTDKRMDFTDLDKLCEELIRYFHKARRMLDHSKCSSGQARELASYVEGVRMLLRELNCRLSSPIEYNSRSQLISELHNYYLELEGIINEIRNDLCWTR